MSNDDRAPYYTGVCSRQAPLDVLQQMTALGAGDAAEVYLPWPSFESDVPIYASTSYDRPTWEAHDIASQHHPAWAKFSRGALLLHARNVHQVLGLDCRPEDRSLFVACWTPGAMGSGGTGQAIRIAREYNVPVVDMASPGWESRIDAILQGVAAT